MGEVVVEEMGRTAATEHPAGKPPGSELCIGFLSGPRGWGLQVGRV